MTIPVTTCEQAEAVYGPSPYRAGRRTERDEPSDVYRGLLVNSGYRRYLFHTQIAGRSIRSGASGDSITDS